MRRLAIGIGFALASTSCNVIFGLDETHLATNGDGGSSDGSAAGSSDGGTADAPGACGGHTCSAEQVCDTTIGNGSCVQCTVDNTQKCSGSTLACGSNDTCVSCAGCESGVCSGTDNNTCAPVSDVAYVAAGGTGDCSKGNPCGTVTLALDNSPSVVLVSGIITDEIQVPSGASVAIVGDGTAELKGLGNAILLNASGGSNVLVRDIKLAGGTVSLNWQPGANSSLTVLRTTIVNASEGNSSLGVKAVGGTTDNFVLANSIVGSNGSGGVLVSAANFDIVGNVIALNGSDGATLGGMSIAAVAGGTTHRVEFNTLDGNDAIASSGTPGLRCSGTFSTDDNIAADNIGGASGSNVAQVGAACMTAYTLAWPVAISGGSHNVSAAPDFVDEGGGNYQLLGSDNPAHGTGDPSSDVSGFAAVDAAGNPRVSPFDIGAFVYEPQQ